METPFPLLRSHHGDPDILQDRSDAPGAGFLDHYLLGAALLERNDLAGAEAATKKALVVAPGHPSALLQLGRIALSRRDPRTASLYLELVVNQIPSQSVGWVMLAEALAASGDPRRAWSA